MLRRILRLRPPRVQPAPRRIHVMAAAATTTTKINRANDDDGTPTR